MKPAFALDFRNEAIALLHRTSGGWHQVGRVTFDEPDLAGALSYLRATALGLSPRGLATKLILPDDQILVTTVDAPGPDDASRAAQIRVGLEGRTPYAVEDLVFDWEEVNGEVHVAVIARETLAEAESFAAEHRFNPVSFGAAPTKGFAREPWFGLTAQADSLLAPGETVERDDQPVMILQRSATSEADPEALPEPDPAEPPLAATEPEVADPETPEDIPVAVEDPAFDDTDPEAIAAAYDSAEPHDVAPEPYREPEPAWQPAPLPPRNSPIFGLADDEPPPSAAFRPAFEPSEPAPLDPSEELPDDLAAALQDIVLEEAPMALDVEDDGGAGPASPTDGQAPAQKLIVTDPSIPDDVPAGAGLSPSMGFASRRASSEGGQAAKVQAPPPRPAVERPTAARPLVAPPAPKAERPALNRPTAARPVAPKESKGLRGLGAFVTAPGIPGTRKKKVLPLAASPAETASPAVAALAAGASQSATSEVPGKGLGRGFGNRPAPVRGKPRHLGLILTAVLLLVLALIAAWSTSLAFRTDGTSQTELAASEADPAVEDEMIADGLDPEAMVEGEAAPTAEPVPETQAATETTVAEPVPSAVAADQSAAEPAANPGAASGDEIFLAAKDLAPIAPEPLDLPEVSAQGDPLPNAQAPPPPFGTVYQFDANGLIVPTPEGIVTPEGVLLVAGKPPLVPRPRPEGLTPPTADPAVGDALQPAVDPATDAVTEAPLVSDPALAGFRPKARPAGLTPPAAPADAADPADTAPTETLPDDAALSPAADSRLAGLRPQARPEAVLAAGEAARAANGARAASLAAQAEAAAATSTSKMAVAISRKPEPRPRDLSRAVEAAVAAAVRAPEPEPEPAPEPEPEQLAAIQPAKSPQPKAKPAEPEEKPEGAAAKSPSRGRDEDAEADAEPEVKSSAARSAPSGSVAKQATFKNALNLEKTALIGVYGTPSKRYAMIRTSNGRYKKVRIGDSIDGGKIKAITATEVRYQKGSKLVTLSLPRG